MTLTLELPPDIEGAIAQAAQRQGTTPERLALDGLRGLFTPQEVDNSSVSPEVRAWEEMLDSFDHGDAQEQKKTLEYLRTSLDRDRPGQRSIFGAGINPMPLTDDQT